ncbi:MAG: hypothetical protein IIU57_04790 [Oscillospiraceae bacterium]|nr:hypothetical protein [Oscillospiraceae bacterium]
MSTPFGVLFFVSADIIRLFFVYDLICCMAGLTPATKLTARKMYIENRCRPRAATVKIRKHYLPVVHLSPLGEQSLRSAPSGRNSEQGLAPRSKYSRLYAAEYFGHRKSLRLREQTAGVKACLWRFYLRFFAPSKKWG